MPPKPYKFKGFGEIYAPKPYKFIGFGEIYAPKRYKIPIQIDRMCQAVSAAPKSDLTTSPRPMSWRFSPPQPRVNIFLIDGLFNGGFGVHS
jgi:hypothetical protein